MKRFLLLFMPFLYGYLAHSQIDHIPVLIGKTDAEVTYYLDSLNNLKNNPYYKIEKDVSEQGDLVYKNKFSIKDEPYYSCLDILVKFNRKDGIETCVDQVVAGNIENIGANLDFVKDNFTVISDGKWELKIPSISAKIIATFKRKEQGDLTFYVIDYYIIDDK